MNTLRHLAILSGQTAVLTLLAFLLTHFLRTWLTARARCWIWGLVILRLCMPISFDAPFSLFNLLKPSVVEIAPWSASPPTLPARTAPALSMPRVSFPEPDQTPASANGDAAQGASLPVPARASTTTPPVGSTPGTARHWPWMALTAWAAVAMTLMARTAWLALRMNRIVARGTPCASPTFTAALDQARQLTRIRGPIRVVIVPGIHSPALHGWWRPTLLVPPAVERLLNPAQLRHVLLHECAHIRRHDIGLNWLMAILQALHWFNPTVWLAFARLRAEREIACDEMALEASGRDEGESYGRTLLHLLTTWSDASPLLTPGAVGLLERHTDLRRRLQHIADFRPGRRLGIPAALLIAVAGAVTLTDAQSPAPDTRGASAGKSPMTHLPPVVPLRYTNALAKPENKDLSSGGNWAKAPRGSNLLGGVHFEIDGLVQLASRPSVANKRGFREFVTLPTPTNRYGAVHLLAATAWSAEPNRRVADVIWRFTDGTVKRSPILYTGHVRDWWRRPFDQPRRVHSSFAKCAVTWSSPDALKNNAALRMYRVTLANPEPTKPVAFIQLQSAMDDASLLVLGVSMDPLEAGRRPDPSPDAEPVDPEWTRHLGVTVIDAGTSNVVGGAQVKATVGETRFPAAREYPANGSGVADVLLPEGMIPEITIEASANGYSPTRHRFEFTATNPLPAFITVRLHGGITIGGVVLSTSGQPIEGATVSVLRYWTSGERPNRGGEDTGFNQQRTRTGADGRWEVGAIPAHRLNRIMMNVEHAEHAPASIQDLAEDPRVLESLKEKRHELRLKPGLAVSGVVLDPEGRPVPKADVRVGALHARDSREGTTDAAGRFRIGGLQGGETVVTAQAKGFGAATARVVVDAKDSPVTLSLTKARIFSGVVTDADHQPLSDVSVGVESSFPSLTETVSNQIEFRTRTGADGTWTWDSGPGNELRFFFNKEGFAGKSDVAIEPGKPSTVVLTRPRVVEGVVIDAESGEPVKEFRIEPRGRWWTTDAAQKFVGPDGRFTLSLSHDQYDRLRITSPTHEPLEETLPAAIQGVIQITLRLKPGEDGSGTVMDPAGRPVARAMVAFAGGGSGIQVNLQRSGRLESWGAAPIVETGADGSFKLEPTKEPFGVFAATPTAFGFMPLAQFRQARRVPLQPYGEIRGTYRGRVDDDGMARLTLQLFTGASGRFAGVTGDWGSLDRPIANGGTIDFSRVPAGRHQIIRLIHGGNNTWSHNPIQDVVVEPGQVTTVDIASQGWQITGRLTVEGRTPLQGLRLNAGVWMARPNNPVIAQANTQTPGGLPLRAYGCPIRPDGTFQADDIPPGRYELKVLGWEMGADPATALSWETTQAFEVPEGTHPETTLDLGTIPMQRKQGAGN